MTENPNITFAEIGKKGGELWRNLSDEEKKVKTLNMEVHCVVRSEYGSAFYRHGKTRQLKPR